MAKKKNLKKKILFFKGGSKTEVRVTFFGGCIKKVLSVQFPVNCYSTNIWPTKVLAISFEIPSKIYKYFFSLKGVRVMTSASRVLFWWFREQIWSKWANYFFELNLCYGFRSMEKISLLSIAELFLSWFKVGMQNWP